MAEPAYPRRWCGPSGSRPALIRRSARNHVENDTAFRRCLVAELVGSEDLRDRGLGRGLVTRVDLGHRVAGSDIVATLLAQNDAHRVVDLIVFATTTGAETQCGSADLDGPERGDSACARRLRLSHHRGGWQRSLVRIA